MCSTFDLLHKTVILSPAPRRSTAYRRGLSRGVEGPRRCVLADAARSFPATNYEEIKKSQAPSEAEGSAVQRIFRGNVFLPGLRDGTSNLPHSRTRPETNRTRHPGQLRIGRSIGNRAPRRDDVLTPRLFPSHHPFFANLVRSELIEVHLVHPAGDRL